MAFRSRAGAGGITLGVLLMLACQERQTAGGSSSATPPASAAPPEPAAASASPPEPPPSAPAASASASASPSGSAEPPLPDFLVGHFSGSTSTYASVANERQTYSHSGYWLKVEEGGTISGTRTQWTSGDPRRTDASKGAPGCQFKGRLWREQKRYRMELSSSTCHVAKAGTVIEFEHQRVGTCVVVWFTRKGVHLFDEQVALRKEGCQSGP